MTVDRVKQNIRNTIEDLKVPYDKAKVFFYQLEQGLDDTVDSVKSTLPREEPLLGKIYKWKDENGNWHYSDRPREKPADPKKN